MNGREALEEIQGDAYLWQIGEGPWADDPAGLIEHLRKVAREALDAAPPPPDSLEGEGTGLKWKRVDEARAALSPGLGMLRCTIATDMEDVDPEIIEVKIATALDRLDRALVGEDYIAREEALREETDGAFHFTPPPPECLPPPLPATQPTPSVDEGERAKFIEAIEEASTSGMWSEALDLFRTRILEPQEARIRELEATQQPAEPTNGGEEQ